MFRSISVSLFWRGILAIAIGVVSVAWPDITALALTLWIGAWAFVTGIIEVTMAFRRGEAAGERALWALGGLVSISLGVVLAIRPDAGALSLATVFGLFSIVSGVSTLVVGAQSRRTHKDAERLVGAQR